MIHGNMHTQATGDVKAGSWCGLHGELVLAMGNAVVQRAMACSTGEGDGQEACWNS